LKLSLFSVQDHYPDGARTVPQLYKQVIDQAVLAEELGYAAFFSAEHHFHPYGVVPNPTALLCAIAQRTTRIRLGTAISILTFHNPRTAAEILRWRISLAMAVSCSAPAPAISNTSSKDSTSTPAEKRDRFDECLAIVERLLSSERVTCHAKFSRLDAVKLNVEPIQRPVPLVKRGPWLRPQASEGEAQHEPFCLSASWRRRWRPSPIFSFEKRQSMQQIEPNERAFTVWRFQTPIGCREGMQVIKKCRAKGSSRWRFYNGAGYYLRPHCFSPVSVARPRPVNHWWLEQTPVNPSHSLREPRQHEARHSVGLGTPGGGRRHRHGSRPPSSRALRRSVPSFSSEPF